MTRKYKPRNGLTFEERFWSHSVVMPSGCREWQLARLAAGYGRVQRDGKCVYTHRAAWELVHGSIPEGLCVLHRCDNPPCVEVSHLFLGTKDDNNKDRAAKGRSYHPPECPQGHAYVEVNIVMDAGTRKCRACKNTRTAAWLADDPDGVKKAKAAEASRRFMAKKKQLTH